MFRSRLRTIVKASLGFLLTSSSVFVLDRYTEDMNVHLALLNITENESINRFVLNDTLSNLSVKKTQAFLSIVEKVEKSSNSSVLIGILMKNFDLIIDLYDKNLNLDKLLQNIIIHLRNTDGGISLGSIENIKKIIDCTLKGDQITLLTLNILNKMDYESFKKTDLLIQQDESFSPEIKRLIYSGSDETQQLVITFLSHFFDYLRVQDEINDIQMMSKYEWLCNFIQDVLVSSHKPTTSDNLIGSSLLLIKPLVNICPSFNNVLITLNVHELIRDLYIKKGKDFNYRKAIASALSTLTIKRSNQATYVFQPNLILEEEIEAPIEDLSGFPIIKYSDSETHEITWVELLFELCADKNDEVVENASESLKNIASFSLKGEVVLQQWLVLLLSYISQNASNDLALEMHGQLARVSGVLWYRFGLSPHVINKKLQRQAIRALALFCAEKDLAILFSKCGGLKILSALENVSKKEKTVVIEKQLSRTIANLTSHDVEEINQNFKTELWNSIFNEWSKSLNLKLKYNARRIVSNIENGNIYADGLFVLFPDLEVEMKDSNLSEGGRAVDLVFVHGLGGSALKTWRSSSSNEALKDSDLYIKNWIPQDLPVKCRILSVDYRAHLFSWDSPKRHISRREAALNLNLLLLKAGVGISNERKVIFVTHSQGGLLVKELLTLETSDLLRKNTLSVIFMATPHLGSPHMSAAPDRLHKFFYSPSLPSLELKSGIQLVTLNEKFCQMCKQNNINSHSFGESMSTVVSGISVFIVPEEYANPKCGSFSIIPGSDHVNINKPKDKEDVRYQTLLKTLLEDIMNE